MTDYYVLATQKQAEILNQLITDNIFRYSAQYLTQLLGTDIVSTQPKGINSLNSRTRRFTGVPTTNWFTPVQRLDGKWIVKVPEANLLGIPPFNVPLAEAIKGVNAPVESYTDESNWFFVPEEGEVQ